MPPVNRFMTDVESRRRALGGGDYERGGGPAPATTSSTGAPVTGGPATGDNWTPDLSDPAMAEWTRIAKAWGLDPNGPFLDDPRLANTQGGIAQMGRRGYQSGNLSTLNLPGDQLEAARAAYERYQQSAQRQRTAHQNSQPGATAGVGDPALRPPPAGAPNTGQTQLPPGVDKTVPPMGGGASGSGSQTPPPLTAADLERWRQEQAAATAQSRAEAKAAQDAQWAKWQEAEAARTAQREADSQKMYQDTYAKFGEASALREQESRTAYNRLLEEMQAAKARGESPEEVKARMDRDTNEGLLYKSLADATTATQRDTADRQGRYDTQAEGDRAKLYDTLDNWTDAEDPYAADAASTRADLLRYRDEAAPEAFQRALEARVTGAMPRFQGQLQDIRETAIRRGVSGALPTSYEGDLASAFQRNIANAGAEQGVDLLGLQTGITSDLNSQSVNRGEAVQGRAMQRTGAKLGSITGMYNSALSALTTNANRSDANDSRYQDTVARMAAQQEARRQAQQGRNDQVSQDAVGNAGSAYDRATGSYQYGVGAGQQQKQEERDWETYQLDRTDSASAAARARRDAEDNAWTGLAGTVAGYALGGPAGGALGSWLSGRRRGNSNYQSAGANG